MERDDEKRDLLASNDAQRLRDLAKEAADARNDELELRENARNRQIAHELDIRDEAMRKLIDEAEKMPRELFDKLPDVNDWNTRKTLVHHGIPDPSDPPNPLMFRDASQTPLKDLANLAWGNTLSEAVAKAAREDERKLELTGQTTKRETLADRMKREASEQPEDRSRTIRPGQEHDRSRL